MQENEDGVARENGRLSSVQTTSRFPAPTSRKPTRGYTELIVWQRAMDLIDESYRFVRLLPPSERFELASQLRRAVVSVAANIAEGHGRLSAGDFVRHLSIARGSLMEAETLVRAASRVGLVESGHTERPLRLADEVSRMLATMIKRLNVVRAGA